MSISDRGGNMTTEMLSLSCLCFGFFSSHGLKFFSTNLFLLPIVIDWRDKTARDVPTPRSVSE